MTRSTGFAAGILDADFNFFVSMMMMMTCFDLMYFDHLF